MTRSKTSISKRYTSSLVIFTMLSFQNAHAADKIDPRSKTEGTVEICIDCVVAASNFGTSNLDNLRGFANQDVAIFSKDPTGQTFVDPREEMNRDTNQQLNAIGVIKVSGNSSVPPQNIAASQVSGFKPGKQLGSGTGFLINECLVVTNHHVAYLAREKSNVSDLKIDFYAGKSGISNSPFALQSSAKIVADGNYQPGKDIKNDWAIIKLDQPVSDPKNPNDLRHNWRIQPAFRELYEVRRERVSSASFYVDNPIAKSGEQLWGEKSCKLWGRGARVYEGSWATDCAGIPGASGSPIFKSEVNKAGQNELVAYGIMQSVRSENAHENTVTDNNLNNMIPFSQAMTPEQLEKIIKDNPCVKTTKI